MLDTLIKYAAVYLSSMIKFVFGPITGLAQDLSFWETALFTVLGMMTAVLIITLLGSKARAWLITRLKLEHRFTKKSERLKEIWSKYGIPGIAFITPLLLTPIGGSVLAIMLGGSRKKIIKYMFLSAVLWAFTISFVFDRLGAAVFGF
ncbi:MAG: hypothetical protein KatS3mg031_0115 [Chitinophagales bacterium]|nr:MAG: hypothetical protein KatS3mg031_0115 [Chitinophagales bacterium]